jgi:hypothetical protein
MSELFSKEDAINCLIKDCDTNKISDGHHTFGELYEHRIALFILLCRTLKNAWGDESPIWKSKKHSDGSSFDGWFILGIYKEMGNQVTYHLPISKWDECIFAEELETAPEWDGHTSNDVLERLKVL